MLVSPCSAFAPPYPLLGSSRKSSALVSSCTSRRRVSVSSSASSTERNEFPDMPDKRFSRLSEFTSVSGDLSVQNRIAEEAYTQVTRLEALEQFDMTIRNKMDSVSEYLTDLYLKSHRDMENKNEELVLKESLENISKWNQTLIEGSRRSRLEQSEISKELAAVQELLRRRQRKVKRGRKGRRRGRKTRTKRDDNGGKELVKLMCTTMMGWGMWQIVEGLTAEEELMTGHAARGAVFVFIGVLVARGMRKRASSE